MIAISPGDRPDLVEVVSALEQFAVDERDKELDNECPYLYNTKLARSFLPSLLVTKCRSNTAFEPGDQHDRLLVPPITTARDGNQRAGDSTQWWPMTTANATRHLSFVCCCSVQSLANMSTDLPT